MFLKIPIRKYGLRGLARALHALPAILFFWALGSAAAEQPRVVKNPYADVNWETVSTFLANFHSHTVLSDGRAEPDLLIRNYAEAGYHILAITDHDNGYNHRDGERDVRAIYTARDGLSRIPTSETTWPWTIWIEEQPSRVWTYRGIESSAFYPELGERGMLAIRGNELSTHPHAVSLYNRSGWPDRNQNDDQRVTLVESYDGLMMWAHPTHYVPGGPWEDRFFHDLSWDTAVEYFGHHIVNSPNVIGIETQQHPQRLALDRELFDRLLARFYPDHDIFIYASDDSHSTRVSERAALTLVFAEELTEEAVRNALTSGHVIAGRRVEPFPRFNRIAVNEEAMTITADVDNANRIVWYKNGREHAVGPVLNFAGVANAVVRFEVEQGDAFFLSQAFYIR